MQKYNSNHTMYSYVSGAKPMQDFSIKLLNIYWIVGGSIICPTPVFLVYLSVQMSFQVIDCVQKSCAL